MSELNFNIQMEARDFLQMSNELDLLKKACEEKDERIEELEEQLRSVTDAYNALSDFINSSNVIFTEQLEICEITGHQLLGGKHIIVIGDCICKPKNLLGYAKKAYGFTNADFRFISDYGKIKNRQVKLRFDKLAGIIVGPMPHYADGVSCDLMKFITDWQDIVPVMVCRSKQGVIKISKQAFADALMKIISETSYLTT